MIVNSELENMLKEIIVQFRYLFGVTDENDEKLRTGLIVDVPAEIRAGISRVPSQEHYCFSHL
jgi:hypothetical protein